MQSKIKQLKLRMQDIVSSSYFKQQCDTAFTAVATVILLISWLFVVMMLFQGFITN